MRVLRRVLGLLIIVLIIPSTACAFWVYNANLVVLDKDTYTPVVQTPFITRDFLVALIDGFTSDTVTERNANAVMKKLPVSAWEPLTNEVFPETSARTALTTFIDDLFNWVDFQEQTLNLSLNLMLIKGKLASADLADAIRKSVSRLKPCTAAQGLSLLVFDSSTNDFEAFPVCQPQTTIGIDREVAGLSQALSLVAGTLPNRWDIGGDIRHALTEGNGPQLPGQSGKDNPLGGGQAPNDRFGNFQLDQARAGLRLQTRVLILLFLVPIGLLFLIVILTIRSLKAFLRWVGWSLVVSGVFSLLPIVLLPGFNAAFVQGRVSIEQGIGLGGEALNVFASAFLQAIVNRLTVIVLFQVAGLIVIGLLCVFLSVVIPPGDDLREEDYARIEKATLGQT